MTEKEINKLGEEYGLNPTKFEENNKKTETIYDIFFTIFDLCGIIKEKGELYEKSRNLLQILWKEIGKEEIQWEIRRFWGFPKEKILQSSMYENGNVENRKPKTRISSSTSNCCQYNEISKNRTKVFNMWQSWKNGYTPYRWELSEQQFTQFNLFMSQLPYEDTQAEICMHNLWQTNESIRFLRETLSKIQEIWRPNENKIQNYRIRKLTPREAWRLMGVKDEDYEKVAKNQSNSSLYHLAGDSIVTNVLMAIFKEMI